jgi:DNA-binding CsgD family transcriptional regulator
MASVELLGRELELSAVERLFSTVAPRPGIVMLEGVNGIGKTAVWLSAVDSARRHGFRVLSCRPTPTDMPLAFSSLGDILDELIADYIPQLPYPQRSALEISLLLRDSKGATPDQRAISLATLNLLRIVAEEAPLVVAIDDVQWLDISSARILAFVFHRIEHELCRVLLTKRTDLESEQSPASPLDLEFASRLAETLERHTIGPLSLGAIQSLIRTRLSARLPRRTLVAIAEASRGNPFFALELARAQLERDGLEPGSLLFVPESLGALVERRVSSLPDKAQEALLIASALSDPTVELVEKAGGKSLDRAIKDGLIEIEGGRIRFSQSLPASVLYGGLSPERRRELHRRLARILTGSEERARHLALGTGEPDSQVAAELEEAARQAAARGAPDAAAELFEQSSRLTPAEAPDDIHRRRIEAAAHCFGAGDVARARVLAESLLAEPGEGPWRADALVLLANTVEDMQEAIDLCRQAIEEAGDDEERLARAYLALARATAILGDFPGQVEAQHIALPHAERAGNPRLLVEALQGVSIVNVLSGGTIDEKLMQRAIEIDRDQASLPAFHSPSHWYGMQLFWTDDLERALPIFREQYKRAAREGELTDSLQILAPLIEVEVRKGNWDEAEAMIAEGLEKALDTGHEWLIRAIDFQRLQLAALRGDVDAARTGIARQMEDARKDNDRWAALTLLSLSGFVELSLYDHVEAWRVLERAIRLQDELGRDISVAMPLYSIRPNAIETLIALDRFEQAESLLTSYEQHVEETGRPNGIVFSARSRALFEAGRGDLKSAGIALERAIAGHELLIDPFERGRTLIVAGTIERRAKRKRKARDALEEAVGTFERLGASIWAERARAELDRVPGSRSGGAELTPTELRVAELVAAGNSNKEVAAQLFMSVRTVEANLSKVYRKLGVESRSGLASHLKAS